MRSGCVITRCFPTTCITDSVNSMGPTEMPWDHRGPTCDEVHDGADQDTAAQPDAKEEGVHLGVSLEAGGRPMHRGHRICVRVADQIMEVPDLRPPDVLGLAQVLHLQKANTLSRCLKCLRPVTGLGRHQEGDFGRWVRENRLQMAAETSHRLVAPQWEALSCQGSSACPSCSVLLDDSWVVPSVSSKRVTKPCE